MERPATISPITYQQYQACRERENEMIAARRHVREDCLCTVTALLYTRMVEQGVPEAAALRIARESEKAWLDEEQLALEMLAAARMETPTEKPDTDSMWAWMTFEGPITIATMVLMWLAYTEWESVLATLWR